MSEVDLARYFKLFIRWLWLILLSVGIAVGVSYWASSSQPPSYRTSFTLMVGEDTTNPNLTIEQVTTSQRLADAYAGMIRRQPVLEATVESLGLQISWRDLQDRLLVNRIGGTQLIEVRVVDSNPQRVKAIAEEIARQIVLESPTSDYMQQVEIRREFVKQQLDSLQSSIQQAEASIAEKQARLKDEVSARAVLDRQDEIQALMMNLTGWRSTYGNLLASYQGRPANTITVIEPAYLPTASVGPDITATLIMAGMLGLVLAMGAILLIEYLYDTVSSTGDVTRTLAFPTLGSIVSMGRSRKSDEQLITTRTLDDPISESCRVVRTNIQFTCVDGKPSMLLVTSPGLHEGKTFTSANLAASFAQSGERTIVVDADLRHPSLHLLFGAKNSIGLSSLFLGEPIVPAKILAGRHGISASIRSGQSLAELSHRLDACLVDTGIAGLQLLPTGPLPANPAEILNSCRMDEVLNSLRDLADVVIIDSPPILPVVDAAVLAAKGVDVVMVLEVGRTRSAAAAQAKETLSRANARVLGVVLNRAPRTSLNKYYQFCEPSDNRKRHRLPFFAGLIETRSHRDGVVPEFDL